MATFRDRQSAVWLTLAAIVATTWFTGVTPARANTDARDATPWLGVGIMRGTSGVLIREVIRDTPAHEAGLVPGDEILVIADTRVATPADLKAVVGKHHIGAEIPLSVWRDGRLVKMSAAIGARMTPDEILYRRLVGERAPAFEVDIVHGRDSGSSSELARRVVVLQFFTLDCSVCVEQHRALSRLAEKHPVDELTIVAIGRDTPRALSEWGANLQPSFSVAYDLSRRAFNHYRIEGLGPALVVIDRTERVVYAGVGGATNMERAAQAAERALRQRDRR